MVLLVGLKMNTALFSNWKFTFFMLQYHDNPSESCFKVLKYCFVRMFFRTIELSSFWMKFDKKAPKVTLLQTHPQLKKRRWMAKKRFLFCFWWENLSGGKSCPGGSPNPSLVSLLCSPFWKKILGKNWASSLRHCHVMVVI